MTLNLYFLGTASCYPTPQRCVSSTALRLPDGEIWLFDCGEGTQVQFKKCGLKPSRVTKIFITHMHGDHVFGLPGFLCTLSWSLSEFKPEDFVLELYGPLGLHKFIETALALSHSCLNYTYRVFELIPEQDQYLPDFDLNLHHSLLRPEACTSSTVAQIPTSHEERIWSLFEDSRYSVRAGWVKHTVPTFGFLVAEKDDKGRRKLNVSKLQALGVQPGPFCTALKAGLPVTLMDQAGKTIIVDPEQVLDPGPQARKILILGDTNDPSPILPLAKDADVVIHEATFEKALESKAMETGHSTPIQAAQFACRVQARVLVLNHFSQRYATRSSDDAQSQDNKAEDTSVLRQEAELECEKLGFHCRVIAAYDFMQLAISKDLEILENNVAQKTA